MRFTDRTITELTPELTWVGDGGWVACDPTLPTNDPKRVIAYLECKDHTVFVLWIRERADAACYDTLRDALRAITASASPSRAPAVARVGGRDESG